MRPLLLSLVLLVAGCAAVRPAPGAASATPTLRWGSSFGMCIGYCASNLVVTPDRVATLTETATRSGEMAPRIRTRTLTDAEAARLAAAYTASTIAATDTLGCPDCADGGAEYVEVDGRRVTFEYGGEAGPAGPLAEALRAVRETFPRLDG
ncbi:MAG TPA: hypothetical protein VF576_06595 [Rubricoccaceae bacterium]|jgi:hypothetical protein